MKATSNIFACLISLFPFSFLSILIGANPRRSSLWEPILSKIRNKLSSWKGKVVSLGGHVTLTISILNSIPLFPSPSTKLLK